LFHAFGFALSAVGFSKILCEQTVWNCVCKMEKNTEVTKRTEDMKN